MRLPRLATAIAALAAAGIALSAAQLPSVPSGARDLAQRLPDLDRVLSPGPVLTSSVADAVGRVGELPDGVGGGRFRALTALPRGPRGEFLLREGRYSGVVESFCLKAGAHAATGGGFLAAPLRGPWASIIEGVLRNAARIPGATQEEVQLLLWDLLARTRIGDLPRPLQALAAQLLSPRDLITVNGGALGLVPQRALDLAEGRLPDGLREVFAAESRIRQLIADGASTYEQFESVAVPDADAARGQVSEIGDDQWIASAQGYFVRFVPIGYQQVRVEVVVPRATARGDHAGLAGPRVLAIGWAPRVGQPAAPLALDLPSILAMPADTGGQRLGLTSIPAPGAQPTDDDDWPGLPITPITPTPPATPTTPANPVNPVNPANPANPVAVLDLPASAAAMQPFDASGSRSSAAAGRQLMRYRWQIEGRPQVETATPTFPIDAQPIGKLTVTLQVVDDMGNLSSPATASVIVSQRTAPVAVLDVPGTVTAPQGFTASATRSSAASGSRLVKYRWQLGERGEVETDSPTLQVSPQPVGKLVVSLVVVDDAGNGSAPVTGTVLVLERD